MNALKAGLARWEVFLLVVLAVTFVCGDHVSKYFLATSNISIALANLMPSALVALPMTLIIIAGEIDISVGSIIGLCASMIAVCVEHHLSVPVALLVGFAVGLLAGGLNGILVVVGGLPSLVVTIGTLALYRGIAQIVLEERGVSGFPNWYQAIGFGTVAGPLIPWSLLIFLFFFAGFAVFLHRSRWGRTLYAIGNNREAARFSGVNVGGTILGCFIASGVMSALAAVVLTAYLDSARSDTAVGLELPVITAVVLGGVNIFGGSGTLVGVFIALMVLAFVQNALGLAGVPPEAQQIATGAVLVTTLIAFSSAGRTGNPRRLFQRLLAHEENPAASGPRTDRFRRRHSAPGRGASNPR